MRDEGKEFVVSSGVAVVIDYLFFLATGGTKALQVREAINNVDRSYLRLLVRKKPVGRSVGVAICVGQGLEHPRLAEPKTHAHHLHVSEIEEEH